MQIKVGDSKPGFFAIASAPDSNNQGLVEVLIKDGPPESAANLLCNISPGTHSPSSLPFLCCPATLHRHNSTIAYNKVKGQLGSCIHGKFAGMTCQCFSISLPVQLHVSVVSCIIHVGASARLLQWYSVWSL